MSTMSVDRPKPGVALSLAGVTKRFANGAGVHDVSFDVASNSVTAVIGPNGSGKTVIFSLICGLLDRDIGSITTADSTRVAYCPDVPQFESWMTATEIVELSVALAAPDAPLDAAEALTACGLAKVKDRRVGDYSRGMLQRLGIAAALALNPKVLILDEPSSALDPIGKADIRSLITEQRGDRTIILSSHSLEEVEQVADHVVVIAEGRVIDQGATGEILSRGVTPRWHVRVVGSLGASGAALCDRIPNATARVIADAVIEVAYESFEAASGPDGLNAALAATAAQGLSVAEVTLVDRDLDAAFARIIDMRGAK